MNAFGFSISRASGSIGCLLFCVSHVKFLPRFIGSFYGQPAPPHHKGGGKEVIHDAGVVRLARP